ncbi:XRE family transcriptional regulator [Rhizobium sp. PP-F2F-G48]|uniref:helix-turn-helix domain-containing protein n=1 Tax=Rhizobium sp. PP-F2F-G48 TaxID=2135651 RepID=UPI00104858D3|nr:XRE family transcriptional regulator [Rhizobium sp. PP-F2F-G48]
MTDSQDINFGKPPFNPVVASGRVLRSTLAAALADTLSSRKLSQSDAARICATDQPTLSKVLKGRHVGVTADKLFYWLAALGCDIEVHVNKAHALKSGEVRAVIHD